MGKMKGLCWGSFQEAMYICAFFNDPQRAYQSVSECKCYTILYRFKKKSVLGPKKVVTVTNSCKIM